MAKRATKAKTTTPTGVESILTALKFCELSSREIGTPNQTHLRLSNHWAVATDGVISTGHKIDADLEACPHTSTLLKALSKCSQQTAITQLGDGRLSIKSGRFQTFIPCLADMVIGPQITPDPPCANINPAVFYALKAVGVIAKENAQRIMLASVMLRSGSAVATDSKILMEIWHGIDLPSLLIPKTFIAVISKIEKIPTYFGFSPTSATFYFDDESWIKTQLYSEQWPDIDSVLNTPANHWEIPIGLSEAVNLIANMAQENRHIYIGPDTVRTHPDLETGTIYEVQGPLPQICLNIDHLQIALSYANSVDFTAGERNDITVFYGTNFRAMLTNIKEPNQTDTIPE